MQLPPDLLQASRRQRVLMPGQEYYLQHGSSEDEENILQRLTEQLERWEGHRKSRDKALLALNQEAECKRMKKAIERQMGLRRSIDDKNENLTKKQQDMLTLPKLLDLLFAGTHSQREMEEFIHVWGEPSRTLTEITKTELEILYVSFHPAPDGSVDFLKFKEQIIEDFSNTDPYAEIKDPHGIRLLFDAIDFKNRRIISKFEFFNFYREVWEADSRILYQQ